MDHATANTIFREDALHAAEMAREAAKNEQLFKHSLRMLNMSNSAELAHVKATNEERYRHHRQMLDLDHEYAKESRTLESEGRALSSGTPTMSHSQTSTGTQTVTESKTKAEPQTHTKESRPKIDLLKRPAEDESSVRMDEKEGAKLQRKDKESSSGEREEGEETKNEVTAMSNETIEGGEDEKAVKLQPPGSQKKIYSVDELLKVDTGDILCPPLMFIPQKCIERQAGKPRRGGGDGGRRKVEFGMVEPPDYSKSIVDIDDVRISASRARTTTLSNLKRETEGFLRVIQDTGKWVPTQKSKAEDKV